MCSLKKVFCCRYVTFTEEYLCRSVISIKLNLQFKTVKTEKLKQDVICDALRDVEPFLQFKKREKHHPRRSATFSKVAG